eukprot:366451-Chlamydomonas_euryale.AAC.5
MDTTLPYASTRKSDRTATGMRSHSTRSSSESQHAARTASLPVVQRLDGGSRPLPSRLAAGSAG